MSISIQTPETIRLCDIDYDNIDYKISRSTIHESLENSIKQNGVLTPPLLLKGKNTYTIITGHNRLAVLKKLCYDYCYCNICNEFDIDSFVRHALLKNYNNEIGPIGKLYFARILLRTAGYETEKLREILVKKCSLPENIYENTDCRSSILDMPSSLRNYADFKNLSYKLLKRIIGFPAELLFLIEVWVDSIPIRLNVFKIIMEYVFDIYKRDENFEHLQAIDVLSQKDGKERESLLLKSLQKIRYPTYSDLRMKADRMIQNMKNREVDVLFPEYFEGDSLEVHLKFTAHDNILDIKTRIEKLDHHKIHKLGELL